MRLSFPANFMPYPGMEFTAYRSKDGKLFYAAQGRFSWSPDDFGTYVFVNDNGNVRVVPLPRREGRGRLIVDPDGCVREAWHAGVPHIDWVPGYTWPG